MTYSTTDTTLSSLANGRAQTPTLISLRELSFAKYVATSLVVTADLTSSTLNGKLDLAGNNTMPEDRALLPIAGTSALLGIYVWSGSAWAIDPAFTVIEGAKVDVIRGTSGATQWRQTAASGTPVFVPMTGGSDGTTQGIVYYFPIGGGASDSDALTAALSAENVRAGGPRIVQIGYNGNPLVLLPSVSDSRAGIKIDRSWKNLVLRGNPSVPIEFNLASPPYAASPLPAAFLTDWAFSSTSLVLAEASQPGSRQLKVTTSVSALISVGDIIIVGGADGTTPSATGGCKPFLVQSIGAGDRTIQIDTPMFEVMPATTTHVWFSTCARNLTFDFQSCEITGTALRFMSLPNVYGVKVLNADRFTDRLGTPYQLIAFDNNSKFTEARKIKTHFTNDNSLVSALSYETSDWSVAEDVNCDCSFGGITFASSSHFEGSRIAFRVGPDCTAVETAKGYGAPCHSVTFNDLTIECSQALSNANASTAFHVTDTTGFVANNVRATQCRKFLVPDNCDAVFKNLWLDQSAIALPGVSLGNGNYCVDIEATTGAAKIVFEDMTWFGLGYEIFGSELWHLFENSTNATSGHEIEFRGKLNYTCTGAYRRINLNVAHATKICVRRNAKENTGISSWNDGFTVGAHFSRGTVIANGAGTSQSIAFCGTTPSDSIGFNCITKAGTPGAIVSTRTSGTGFAVSFASGDTSTYEYWIG